MHRGTYAFVYVSLKMFHETKKSPTERGCSGPKANATESSMVISKNCSGCEIKNLFYTHPKKKKKKWYFCSWTWNQQIDHTLLSKNPPPCRQHFRHVHLCCVFLHGCVFGVRTPRRHCQPAQPTRRSHAYLKHPNFSRRRRRGEESCFQSLLPHLLGLPG